LSENLSKADDGYATVFYDGAEELSNARSARLAPGLEPEKLAIYFKDRARFRIRGQVVPEKISGKKLMFVPKGSDLSETRSFLQLPASGEFEIRAVSPGSYLLLATGVATDGQYSSDVMTVNVSDSDVEGIRLALAPERPVSGTMMWEGNPRADLSELRVKLVRGTAEFDQTLYAVMRSNGSFRFDSVASSNYDLAVEPLPPGTYLKSARSGGLDLLVGGPRFLSGQPVQIVLATAADTLDIHVTKEADPAAGAEVVLIPDFPMRRRPERYLTGFTDASGNLHLSAVPPGGYTAYAFEQIEPGSYFALAAPGADNRFKDRAVSVRAVDGGKAIQLKMIPAAETAGGLN
jgi:hypothetical protein